MNRAVLKYPLLSEKSSGLQAKANQYTFAVEIDANKEEIRREVLTLKKGIEVLSVRTMIVRGKKKRMGKSVGRRSNWKKAIVRLKAGQTLELFEAS